MHVSFKNTNNVWTGERERELSTGIVSLGVVDAVDVVVVDVVVVVVVVYSLRGYANTTLKFEKHHRS